MKKLVSVCLCFVLISICILSGNYTSINAAEKKTYSVKVGKKLTLKTSLKNAVWGSDDTSIATVSSKGVVKGGKKGSCTIVATANGKSELFSINVIKSKKKNVVEITYDEIWNDYSFKEPPVAYVDGFKVIYYETKLSDLMDALNKSDYSCYCENDLNDIVAYDFDAVIWKKSQKYATIEFKVSESMLAKDAVVTLVNITKKDSDFYYFNNSFKPSKLPNFDDFKKSSLFSQTINWYYYEDRLEDNTKTINAYQKIYYYTSDGQYSYTLDFGFDATTHECLGFTME